MSTQTTDLTAWLDGLEEARKAATPGPWKVAYPFRKLVDLPDRLSAVTADRPKDAALIVAAVNALPEMVAVVRGVLALAEEFDTLGRNLHSVPAADAYDDAAVQLRAVVAAAHTEEGR
jgi:hypothetical protein